jgi:hypothetical protein
MPRGIIYKVTNIINGKSYIGQTVQLFNIRMNSIRAAIPERCSGLGSIMEDL